MTEYYTNVQRYKSEILYRGVKNGKKITRRDKFRPTLYVKDPTSSSQLKTVDGCPVSAREFKNMWDAREFLDRYQTQDGYIHGMTDYVSQYIAEFGGNADDYDFSVLQINSIDIETTCENGFPDIEEAAEQITVITSHSSQDSKYYVFTLKPEGWAFDYGGDENTKEYIPSEWEDTLELPASDVVHRSFPTEADMLTAFLEFWWGQMPDIVTGWNISLFDIPYLIHRLARLLGPEAAETLSPWGKCDRREVQIMNKVMTKYVIYGVAILDYLDLYKKFSQGDRASYKLDYIASLELKKKKLSYEEHASMHLFYKSNYAKFVAYNIRDVELIVAMEQALHMIELAVLLAYTARINYDQIFSPVRIIENICFHHLRENNIVFPPRTERFDTRGIKGAFVKPPQVGKHDWVVSFDLNSLYPSIIIQQNMSPETIISDAYTQIDMGRLIAGEQDLKLPENQTVCANGYHFDTSKQGFFPEIVSRLYNERCANKNKSIEFEQKAEIASSVEERKELLRQSKIYDIRQHAQKILLNSIYGATANRHFVFYDTRIAEGITQHGQFIIQWAERHINTYLNSVLKTEDIDYVVAIDTDSLYITLDRLVKRVADGKSNDEIVEFINRVCKKKIEPFLIKCYKNLASYTQAYTNHMKMKREVIASRGIWTGKKHYALAVYDKEGVRYSEPKLKAMGLETVKSSTPQFCRKALEKALKIALTKEERDLREYVHNVEKKYYELDISEIAMPRGVTSIDKWWDNAVGILPRCPIHVRAAITYNNMLDQLDNTAMYPRINEGDKIKFVYLRKPNKSRQHVIAFVEVLPDEFGLEESIDKKKMFEKTFERPLQEIVKFAGWNVREQPTLESFFC